jgi:hypothetical protein
MRLRVIFGFIATKEVVWWLELDQFPNLIKYLGKNYECVTHDSDLAGKVDYVLTFSPLMSYDPNYDVFCPVWGEMFPPDTGGCECGAAFTSFPWDHLRMCRLWKPW